MAFEKIPSFRHAGRPKPPIPQATRSAVLRRSKGHCENCGDLASLELHHLNYDNEGLETVNDLVVYCRRCHLNAHLDLNRDFWADPEEMNNFWATY